jgi:adenylate cyclase
MGIFHFGIITIGLIGSYICTAFALFLFIGLIIPVFPVIIPLAGVYFFSSVYKYANTEREKGILEGSLQSYLPPSLMEKVRTNPDELLKVGGERKRISVLFADVVDFTHFCDEADPEEVQDVLERYFKEMAAIIFSEHGTIDKYIGDAILAFFENQGDEVTSASTAVRIAGAYTNSDRKGEPVLSLVDLIQFPGFLLHGNGTANGCGCAGYLISLVFKEC